MTYGKQHPPFGLWSEAQEIDLWADRSALAKGAAFVAAAAAADAVAAVTGEPGADADESAALHVGVEGSAAGEDGSGWEW